MRRLIISTQTTADGVIDRIDEWYIKEGEHDKHGFDQLLAADALLLGRKTYEGLSSVWPKIKDEDGPRWSERVNSIPKYVASRTPNGPLTWNATPLRGGLVEAVSALKQQPGGNLISYGCGELAYHLATSGLADEIRLWVHPVVLGGGERLFGGRKVRMRLAAATTFDSGVALLCYRPERSSPAARKG
jgi:dihydrofolate reductase